MTFTFKNLSADRDDLRVDVLTGLAASPKSIPPKYFYDEAGCRLFEAICAQPEYVLCRTEQALMRSRLPDIAAAIGAVDCIVEPGAGDCVKVRRLLDALHPGQLVVMDIAGAPLAAAAEPLSRDYPDLAVTALGMDFLHDLEAAAPHLPAGRRLIYYPGSSIGNFPPDAATALLARFRRLAGADGQLLIGFDLKKDPQRLHAAYNDAAGVTAAFNLNLLVRLNRELGADFDPARFSHYAFYNPVAGRIEMHLVSLAEQDVSVAGERFHFALGETLHTEHSYKFRCDEFSTMARNAGWQWSAEWTQDGFAVQLYR
ncbi:MAG: L-histidine N(alpha)-methyltransferase [Gammaproteobacteria bacterium]|nr:L-histidine N(alpha)-methyltransferase [Gammaproteobacteria bacterium]MBU1406693.1 L-histidine N(alpha)-methyltransferase [Gammaproteobacteria bacterium]MBU1533325.1 L-histidine N(alpha)-methyltransferase [Gammaproteobacteria bacterium]